MLTAFFFSSKGSGPVNAALKSFVAPHALAPELVIIYARSFDGPSRFYEALEEQSVHGPLSYLETLLKGTRGGSVVVPYAELAAGPIFERLVLPLAGRLQGARVFSSGISHPTGTVAAHSKFLSLDELCTGLPRDALASKVPDVVLVDLDGADASLAKLDECLYKRTSGNYLSVFASRTTPALDDAARVERAASHMHATRATVNRTSTNPNTYFPTYVWGWLLVIIFLVIFFGLSIKSLSHVQVPPKLLSAAQVAHRKNK